MGVERVHEAADRARRDDAIGIEEEDERLRRDPHPLVAARREAAVLRRADHPHPPVGLEAGDDRLEDPRIGGVVHHDHLGRLREHPLEAVGEHGAGVVIDDHDRDGGQAGGGPRLAGGAGGHTFRGGVPVRLGVPVQGASRQRRRDSPL